MKTNFLFRTPLADVYEPEQDILYAIISVDFEITLEMAEAFNKAASEATNSKKFCILVDGRNVSISNISRDVMGYSSNNTYSDQQIAIALLIHGKLAKSLASFYVRIFRPSIPTRLFNDEQEALNWLRSMKAQNTVK